MINGTKTGAIARKARVLREPEPPADRSGARGAAGPDRRTAAATETAAPINGAQPNEASSSKSATDDALTRRMNEVMHRRNGSAMPVRGPKPDTVSDRILRALAAHPEAAFDIDEVTFIIGAPRDRVARALGHLRKARQIDRVGLGIYRAHRS